MLNKPVTHGLVDTEVFIMLRDICGYRWQTTNTWGPAVPLQGLWVGEVSRLPACDNQVTPGLWKEREPS